MLLATPRRYSRLEIATLGYHEVVDNAKESGFQRPSAIRYKHPASEFAKHLEKIVLSPVRPVLITSVDFARPGKYLLLTFDDGGKSALYVADQLCKNDWKAHFFIVTSLIGTRTFLDINEIKYLNSCGHIIGSHSHTHPDIFKDQSFDNMIKEWNISCDVLSQTLGTSCFAGAVPGGDISPTVLRSADAAGIRYLFTSEPVLTPKQEGACWIIGRACIKSGSSLDVVNDLVNFKGWTKQLRRWRTKVLLKTTMFPLYKYYVRRRTREWTPELRDERSC